MRDTFPEPYVVPGNVAEAPYREGLRFKQRTIAYWALLALVSGWFSKWPLQMSLGQCTVVVASGFVLLTVVRRAVTPRKVEVLLSFALCLALQPVLGTLVNLLYDGNIDLRLAYVVPVGLVVYTFFAGHDFSHFGYAVLGSVFAVACGVAMVVLRWSDPLEAAFATVMTVVATVYVASDLSMLMRRRLPGEEAGATVDLFRDTLNFITYSFRVVSYVRRYRFH